MQRMRMLRNPSPVLPTDEPQRGFALNDPAASRQIKGDPRELWWLALPNKLPPKTVLMILRSALAGDLWQEWQLFSLMLDSWPMLKKCVHEICMTAANTKFVVRPFCIQGEEPSNEAKGRADFIEQSIRKMRPDPSSDEGDFSDLVYDIAFGLTIGITCHEIMWAKDAEGLWYPRAQAWVHPRHFTYGNGGRLVFTDSFDPNKQRDISPDKFIIAQYKSRSGSALGSGLLRPLAWWWSAIMYCREWMLEFTQRFGQPVRWANFRPGTPPDELTKIDEMLSNMGTSGWARFPEGMKPELTPAQSMSQQNPHAYVMNEADKACQILLLGQTATTSGTPGKLGGEDTMDDVRRERLEHITGWVGEVLSQQLIPAMLRLNYGEDSEAPTLEPDYTQPQDPIALAQRDSIFLSAGVPLHAEVFYKRHGEKVPEKGDMVIVSGKLGTLGDTTTEIAAVPQPPPQLAPGAEEVSKGGIGIPGKENAGKTNPDKVALGSTKEGNEKEKPKEEPAAVEAKSVSDIFAEVAVKAADGSLPLPVVLVAAAKVADELPVMTGGAE